MSRKTRFIVALVFALLVGACSLESSRRSIKSASYMMEGRTVTLGHMKRVVEAIDVYQRQTGRLPSTIEDVRHLKDPTDATRALDAVDEWNRPLIYRVRSGHATLTSFGADGKPGGSWINQDIDSDHPRAQVRLPIRDFVRLPTFPQILYWTLLPTAIAFILVFFGTKDDRRPSVGAIVTILIVGVITVLFSGFITLLDVYPDH